jgi:hypothetical protein
MGESYVQVPPDSTGKKLRTRQRTVGANTIEEQYFIAGDVRVISFKGRACTFRTPGRAGTAAVPIFTIHNATGSTILADVTRISVDLINTAVRAITVEPQLIRLQRFTVLPTNGTALTKVAMDTALSSNASITVKGDASADRTLSASALGGTFPANNIISQEYAPRNFTAVGQEAADRCEFLEDPASVVTLRALEGLAVMADYNAAATNPATDFWAVTCEWFEYTTP